MHNRRNPPPHKKENPMKRSFQFALAVSAAALLAACNNPFDKKAALETDTQKFSYVVGVDIARSLEPIRDEIDLAALEQGIRDVTAKEKLAFDDATLEKIKVSAVQKLREKKMKEMEAKASGATATGTKFLSENAKKPGVKSTASGLQYEVITEGKGARPLATDVVTVHYKGTLINGETFDSSVERGQPASFPLNQVIPGWTEGVQLMSVGSKYKLYIPGNLAYGPQGSGSKIGPNETLIFEVELLDIQK